MKIKNKYVNEAIFLLIGILLLSLFIWLKFIRERLPKDIPLFLTEIRFYSIVFICLTFIYMIKITIFPRNFENIIIKNTIDNILKPIKVLDEKFKENIKICNFINSINESFIDKYKDNENIILKEILKRILPKLILVIIFIIDVLIINKIEIFYYFILLGIIPLYYRYKKYQFKNGFDIYLKYCEKVLGVKEILMYDSERYEDDYDEDDYLEGEISLGKYDVGLYNDEGYTLNKFANIINQEEILVNNKKKYIAVLEEGIVKHYRLFVLFTIQKEKNFVNENFTKLQIKEYEKKQKLYLETLSGIEYNNDIIVITLEKKKKEWENEFFSNLEKKNEFLDIYNEFADKEKNKFIKTIKVFIYFGYLICWSYILYKSYNTINNLEITKLVIEKFQDNIEPFSMIKL
jgi:hypothetical protein